MGQPKPPPLAHWLAPPRHQRPRRRVQPQGDELPVSRIAWATVAAAAVATVALFLVVDPNPSGLLSICMGANVAIIGSLILRLYQWRLLLSPPAGVVLWQGAFVFYTVGNLGPRVYGEGRYISNPGSLEAYPLTAAMTTAGLALFTWLITGPLSKSMRRARIRYEDLVWRPWQAIAAAVLMAAVFNHLSRRYQFVGGYFVRLSTQYDRWLAASQYMFVMLVLLIGISVMLRGRDWTSRILGAIAVATPMITVLMLRSRTAMLTTLILAAVCWIALRPRHTRWVCTALLLAVPLLYVAGTVVKAGGRRSRSMSNNLAIALFTDQETMVNASQYGSKIDLQYRMAGLELPSALVACHLRGAQPMRWGAMMGGAFSGLPGFLRPEGEVMSERIAILNHFGPDGLRYGDSIGLPLSSGIADWGLWAGWGIYGVIALYCLAVWRVAQSSPRLFFAYLVAGAAVGDLFWENAFFAIRAIGFMWLFLMCSGELIKPGWLRRIRSVQSAALPQPPSNGSAAPDTEPADPGSGSPRVGAGSEPTG